MSVVLHETAGYNLCRCLSREILPNKLINHVHKEKTPVTILVPYKVWILNQRIGINYLFQQLAINKINFKLLFRENSCGSFYTQNL